MSELERLRELAANEDVLRFPSRHLAEYGGVMRALPGLLTICDAYIEAEAELLFAANGGDLEYCREQAGKKLEELLG